MRLIGSWCLCGVILTALVWGAVAVHIDQKEAAARATAQAGRIMENLKVIHDTVTTGKPIFMAVGRPLAGEEFTTIATQHSLLVRDNYSTASILEVKRPWLMFGNCAVIRLTDDEWAVLAKAYPDKIMNSDSHERITFMGPAPQSP